MDLRLSLFLLCMALGMVIGLRSSQHADSVFNVDEAVSAAIGMKIMEGGVPYRDGVDHRGPLTYYIYACVFAGAGAWNMQAVHILFAFGICMMAGILYILGKEWGGIAAILLAVFSWTLPPEDVWAAHVEWPMIFWTCLAMLVLSSHHQQNRYLWLVGICVGLAVLSKQVAAWDAAAISVWLFCLETKSPIAGRILKIGWVGGGGITVMIGMGLLAWYGGFLDELWLYAWTYNVDYYLPELTWAERWSNALNLGRLFKDGALLLVILGIVGGGAMIYQWKQLGATERLWMYWLLGASMGVLTSGRDFVHYTIQVLPPLCLVASYGVRFLWQQAKYVPAQVGRVVLLGFLLVGIGKPLWHTWQLSQVYVPSHKRIQAKPATYIEERTKESDYVFVWGFATEFYVYAQRRPASRFVYCNMLTGLIPWENYYMPNTDYAIIPGSWDQLMNDLAQRPPAFVIDTSPADHHHYGKYPMNQYPVLADWLHEHYTVDTSFIGLHPPAAYRLYRRKGS